MILEEIFDFAENYCVSVLFTCVLDSNNKKASKFFLFWSPFYLFPTHQVQKEGGLIDFLSVHHQPSFGLRKNEHDDSRRNL